MKSLLLMPIKKIQEFSNFLEVRLWTVKLASLSKRRAFLYKQIRVIIITLREYGSDRCAEKASSLTYFTLLSVVPVVAIAFAIATAFNLEEFLKTELQRYFSGQQEVLNYTLEFAESMLNNTSGGIISGISTVFLIYAVARLFHNIEYSFNDIWDTKKSRTFRRKLTDYMAIILLAPILLILSSTATVYITTQVDTLTEQFVLLGSFKGLIMFLLSLIPYVIVWLLFFLIYIIFPNTKVKIMPALVAGVISGSIYQVTQWAYINFQVGVSNYSAIYGSFAALPLFLIWVNISWLIVLFGAELAYAIQNLNHWKESTEVLRVNMALKKRIYLYIMRTAIHDFKEGRATKFDTVFNQMYLPAHFLMVLFDDLVRSGLLNKLENELESIYQPATDIHDMTVNYIFKKVDEEGIEAIKLELTDKSNLRKIEQVLSAMEQTAQQHEGTTKLLDL